MDSTLAAGIIGSISTILAVVIPLIIQEMKRTPISGDRQKFLEGTWSGTVLQSLNDGTSLSLKVDLTMEIKRRSVLGSGVVLNAEQFHYVTLNGAFRNDHFLKMDYENKSSKIVQFGCFIFELGSDSETLTGRFVGYGHKNKTIVHGTCSFKKITS